MVSIHARTGRATQLQKSKKGKKMFQFTRARGARRRWCFRRTGRWCFNSRAHGARDTSRRRGCRRTTVSIHARTGRATPAAVFPLSTARFNSRAHGARDRTRTRRRRRR